MEEHRKKVKVNKNNKVLTYTHVIQNNTNEKLFCYHMQTNWDTLKSDPNDPNVKNLIAYFSEKNVPSKMKSDFLLYNTDVIFITNKKYDVNDKNLQEQLVNKKLYVIYKVILQFKNPLDNNEQKIFADYGDESKNYLLESMKPNNENELPFTKISNK